MDSAIERRIGGEAMLENVDLCRSRSENININDAQIFPVRSEQISKLKFQIELDGDSKPKEEEQSAIIDGDTKTSFEEEDHQCEASHQNKHFASRPDTHANNVHLKLDSSNVPSQTVMAPDCTENEKLEVIKTTDIPENREMDSKSFDDDDDGVLDGNICARTYLSYDRTKRQCLERKNSATSHKSNENQAVNKRKKTTPQKVMCDFQSIPSEYRQDSCWSEDKNLNRLQTPIVTCSQKMNGSSSCSLLETKSNGHAHNMKTSKRCAETYLSSAHLWPSFQGSAQKAEAEKFESGWLSAYYANLFFSSFPLMFQNQSSMFPYPFFPSFNNPLNIVQQTSPRVGSSSVCMKKSSIGTRNEFVNNKISDKNMSCDPPKTNLTKLNNSESALFRKFQGDSAPPFWSHARLEDAAQELKRKYHHSQSMNDLKALDLSKSSASRKTRRTLNCHFSKPSYDAIESDNNALSSLNHSVFSEFMKGSITPKFTSATDNDSKEYCKSYNGNLDSLKKSSYDNHSNPKSSGYSKSLMGNLGWMTNDLLLQPPLMPTLSFLKWTPEELSDYIEKIDGCTETAKALLLRGISGSQLPMLTLDIMTKELGLSMTSAQNLMNIVRNLLSTTIPGETL